MEIVIVLVVALIVLGPKRLPATARSMGRGMREFKDAVTGADVRYDEAEALPQSKRAA